MPNPLLVMESANLFCGSAPQNDTASNHLTLMPVQFPTMDVQYVDHRPGGSPVGIEIDTIMAQFECKFELIGIMRQVMELLLRFTIAANDFCIYGNVRDIMTGEAIQAEVYMHGQLAAVEPGKFQRGQVMNTTYTIRGLRRYKFSLGAKGLVGNKPIYDWDFWTNTWAVGGVNQNGFQGPTPF